MSSSRKRKNTSTSSAAAAKKKKKRKEEDSSSSSDDDGNNSSDDEGGKKKRTISRKRKKTLKLLQSDEEDEATEEEEEEEEEEGEDDFFSNIRKVEPKVGMKLEIRDTDYVWSAGTILKVIKYNTRSNSNEKGYSHQKKKKKKGKNSKGGKKNTTTIQVKVASTGWGREWDEVLEWPSERLAKMYTYTKEVRCFVDLLKKPKSRSGTSKKNYFNSTLWPIRVQFRMPHPGVKHAREHLRIEDKIFIKPYGIHLLPSEFGAETLMKHDGGCWFHHSRLRLWKDFDSTEKQNHKSHSTSTASSSNNLGTSTIYHPNFMEAYKLARADAKNIPGVLLPSALVRNSLLRDKYRVHNVRGCIGKYMDGQLRDYTAIPATNKTKKKKEEEEVGLILPPDPEDTKKMIAIHNKNNEKSFFTTTTAIDGSDNGEYETYTDDDGGDGKVQSAFLNGQKEELQQQQLPSLSPQRQNEIMFDDNIILEEPEVCEPPYLPEPITIDTSLYPRSGVVKCSKSNNWIASVARNGNQVFIGAFPTESQAWIAIQKATTTEKEEENGEHNTKMPRTMQEAKQFDLNAVTMEHIIDAYENNFDPAKHNFSLHTWTLQKIHYMCYLKEKQAYDAQQQRLFNKKNGHNNNNNGGNNNNNNKSQQQEQQTTPMMMMMAPPLRQGNNKRKSKRKGFPRKIVRPWI